jgi:hypothetical protein
VKTEAIETVHVPSGTATGSLNPANNVVTLSIPLADVGSPPAGATLSSPLFETDVLVGSPLYTADSQPARAAYKAGNFRSC